MLKRRIKSKHECNAHEVRHNSMRLQDVTVTGTVPAFNESSNGFISERKSVTTHVLHIKRNLRFDFDAFQLNRSVGYMKWEKKWLAKVDFIHTKT